MRALLERIKLQNKKVSLYGNTANTSSFMFGSVISVSESKVLLYLLSPSGDFDGFLLKNIEDIYRVEFDDQYSKKMQRLIKSDALPPYPNKLICDTPKDLTICMLQYANQEEEIVSIELLNSGIINVIGFVQEINKKLCAIQQIDELGNLDGITYIYLQDITQISAASSDERNLYRLYQNNQGSTIRGRFSD